MAVVERSEQGNSPVKVLVADDHTLVREGVRLLLDAQPDFRVVAEAADGTAAVRLSLECLPDIVILDVRMPEMDGLAAFKEIHAQAPKVKAVLLSMYDDRDVLLQALLSGVRGFILKGASSAELIDGLRVVAQGEVYLSPRMQSLLVEAFLAGWRTPPVDEAPPDQLLSPREQEVLLRIAQGQTNAQIAADLVISQSTVQTHRTRILEKLHLKSRSDLVKYALRHGLITLSS